MIPTSIHRPHPRQVKLRHILGIQSTFIALFPFVLLCVLVGIFAVPEVETQFRSTQIQLSTSIAARVENHLLTVATLMRNSAELLTQPMERPRETRILESNLAVSPPLKALYLVSPTGQMENFSLKSSDSKRMGELMGIDMSRHWIFRRVMETQATVWSDIHLPMGEKKISVVTALPTGNRVLMGEIDLTLLNEFLGKLTAERNQHILILDRKGQVIADPEGRLAGDKTNLGHIPLVQRALSGTASPSYDEFDFNQVPMVATILKTRFIHWNILVLTPAQQVYSPVRTTFIVLVVALVLTLLAGTCFAMLFASRMADRFETLAGQLRRIASGETREDWPTSDIVEFKSFAGEIRQMAQAITQREAYNRILFADSPAAMLVLDSLNGQCKDCNQAALALFGKRAPEEMAGHTLESFSPATQSQELDSAKGLATHMETCLETGKITFDWIFLRKKTEEWHGEVTFSRFTHGKRNRIQVILHDITHEREIERERQVLESQLLQAQKMESIGTLSGGIAHDFNNILFPISGYTELMLLEAQRGSVHHDYLTKIMESVHRARDLVRRILTFSRQNETRLEGVWIHEVAREALKLVGSTLPATIMIQDNIQECPHQVLGNSTQIHQIIMNLCTNAFHAMEDGGGILTLGLDTVELKAWDVKHIRINPGQYACISVTDTGVGMDTAVLDQIFHPYFTTKDTGKGTGLGLSVVHGIVRAHGGHISVDSYPDSGTRFKVYLPLTRNGLPQAALPPDAPKPARGKGHILVVDDEVMIVKMLATLLTHMGYQVTTETQSTQALETFKADKEGFDLVITDMTMPGMTGYQLAGNIMTIRPDTPIILCTGYSETMTREKAAGLGISGFLSKPILRQELAAMIEKVLGQTAGEGNHSSRGSSPSEKSAS